MAVFDVTVCHMLEQSACFSNEMQKLQQGMYSLPKCQGYCHTVALLQ